MIIGLILKQTVQRLTTALSSENERWGENVSVLRHDAKLLTGDVLLASAFISYMGPFTKPFRSHLMDEVFTLRDYFDLLHDGVSGYALSESNIQRAMDIILVAVIDPSLPKYEIDEQLSFLSGRIDSIEIHNMMGTNVTNLREGRQKQTIVGGAKSLSDAVPCLSEIGSMGGNSIKLRRS